MYMAGYAFSLDYLLCLKLLGHPLVLPLVVSSTPPNAVYLFLLFLFCSKPLTTSCLLLDAIVSYHPRLLFIVCFPLFYLGVFIHLSNSPHSF
jgi:hypothetical protein